MTAAITTPWGERVTGQNRVWLGRRRVEVETSDGRRHTGLIAPDRVPNTESRPLNLGTSTASPEAGATR